MHRKHVFYIGGILIAIALFVAIQDRLPLIHAQNNKYVTTGYASYKFNVLRHPTGIAFSPYGMHDYPNTPYLLIADTDNHVIRDFNIATGYFEILAGHKGTPGYGNGALLGAYFNR